MDLFKNLVLDEKIKRVLLFPLILKEQFRILIIGDPSTGKTDILNSLLKNAYRAQLINSNFEYHMNYFSKPNSESFILLIDNFEDSREAGLLELDEHFGDVSIVATMRPDLDRFEFLEPPVNQSHIPYSISNNFNLIIPLFDIPNISEDEKKAKYFFNMWENDLFKDEIIQFLEFETEFTEDSKKALIEIYKTERDKFNVSLLDEVVDCDWQLPFVLKDLDTLKKMSIAVAKLNKSKEVTVEHVKEAVEIFDYFKKLYNKGISGANHSTKSSRVHNNQVFEEEIGILHNVLKELREKEGEHIVVERVFEELEKKNINKQVTEKLLLGLKKMGDIYEPKKGVLRML